jgi:salicylate 5-hydroxylase large subunit
MGARQQWPTEGVSRIPFWVYTDPEIYAREQERIFCGKAWAYVALEAEIPTAGDFKRSTIGDTPVVVVRDETGRVNVVENRCAHRGVQFCQPHLGHVSEFMCPYHQWTYTLQGDLTAVPFRYGIRGQGGMPEDFEPQRHGLRKLQVATRHGVVFASFADDVEPLEDYLGLDLLKLFDRVFDGRVLEVLGYSRQLIPANWKLMFENIKDPYHASLLHVFLVTFGLFRADNPSQVRVDKTGRHGALISSRGEQQRTADNAEMKSLLEHFKLHDPSLLQPVQEFPDYTVVMTTVWPNLIIQQQSNTLATRQLIPKGPQAFELAWTFFGYKDEPADLRQRRIRQANLMGPAGLVSVDDGEVIKFSQDGLRPVPQMAGMMEMGGRDWQELEPHMVTEGAIRGFYDYYRRVMEL